MAPHPTQQPRRPVTHIRSNRHEHVLRSPCLCPPALGTRNVISVSTVGVLLIEFDLVVRDKIVVLSNVAVLLPNLPEHTPRLPSPTLDRGNPQLPRAVKTDIRPLGVLQIPRPGVTVPFHLNAVLGWQSTVWHPRGRNAHQIGGDGRD
jgi:hypothetical protein